MIKRLCVLTKRLYVLMKRSLRQINAMNGIKAIEDALLKRQKAVKMPGASQTVIKTNVQHSTLEMGAELVYIAARNCRRWLVPGRMHMVFVQRVLAGAAVQ